MTTPNQPLWPDWFDSLAALNRLRNVREGTPAFYQKHRQALDLAESFLQLLASFHPAVQLTLMYTLAPVADPACALRSVMPILGLDMPTIELIDQQTTGVLQSALPIIRDAECPGYLRECRWGIEDAFETTNHRP